LSRYELLIIGGGINGLGIAAAAAARGLSVLLVEKGDFGGGTTAASSRLIHGGLRYLQYGEIGLVRESLRERGVLARQRRAGGDGEQQDGERHHGKQSHGRLLIRAR